MSTSSSRDQANILAAKQEAESRKLTRKQSFQKKDKSENSEESPGVIFEEGEIGVSSNSEEPASVDSTETSQQSVSSTSQERREIKIITDGTYKNTEIFINSKKIITSDMSILISKEKGVDINFIQKISLFGE